MVDVDDLRAAAWSDAVNAVDRFDSTRGEPLEAYASVMIRGGVLNEIRAADPLGEKLRAKLRHARTMLDNLRAPEAGPAPGDG